MKRANTILAETFGWDASEVSDYRYQRYASPAVYAIGDKYFAVSKVAPRHKVGGVWRKHTDQFFTEEGGSAVWVCDAE